MASTIAKFLTTFLVLMAALTAVISVPCRANDDNTEKINKLIAGYAAKLDVASISLSWSEQAEGKKIRGFDDTKRSAAILATIWELAQNDDIIFTKLKSNDYQVLVSMLTRIHAYTFLTNLLGATAHDAIIKDFLEQEVVDLKSVFARKNTVTAYETARKMRDDKLGGLLKDPKFVSELIKFRNGKDKVTRSLANVTTMLGLIEACTTNANLCMQMEILQE